MNSKKITAWQKAFNESPAIWLTRVKVDREYKETGNVYASKEAAQLEIGFYERQNKEADCYLTHIHSLELSKERWERRKMSYFVFWDVCSGGKLKSEHKFYFVETNHGLEHAVEIFSWETKLDKNFFGVDETKDIIHYLSFLSERTGESVKFLNFSSFKI